MAISLIVFGDSDVLVVDLAVNRGLLKVQIMHKFACISLWGEKTTKFNYSLSNYVEIVGHTDFFSALAGQPV